MKILTPATSANLGPGFDSLGLSLKLYNEVTITKQNFTSVCISGEGSDKIGLKKNNTFVNIFNETMLYLTGKIPNFRFNFINNIPFSRGLGSSSSVIVGAIASAYHMAGFKVDRALILNQALKYENHPDNISPAVWGGFTSNIVHKGTVYTQKADISSDLRAVVVIPDKPTSTKQSRGKLPKTYPMADVISNVSHAAFLTACFIKQDYENLRLASIDKMHEVRRMHGLKELFRVREIAYLSGALMSNLSGSGSSFLNLAHKDRAQTLRDILQLEFPEFKVEIYEFDNNGFILQS
ncbi:serine kinase [Campylobacter fetus subsp. testudinum]|uniref:homoserine kinase n=1 Tax=Campylobacter fetus TaxID=196 RepID=UPI000818C8EC|nr:homoserine kinase [Campylobacter fetus]OCR89347.1 serine kinase [Campylobacter fetus subsp. testudinum]OCR99810.1 homoserine kinase [Campylobacter fetus subsp. testudinum]